MLMILHLSLYIRDWNHLKNDQLRILITKNLYLEYSIVLILSLVFEMKNYYVKV